MTDYTLHIPTMTRARTTGKATEKTVEQLKEARHKIILFGWIKGDYGRDDCGYCAAGAIKYSINSDDWGYLGSGSRALKELCVTLAETDFKTGFGSGLAVDIVSTYNDMRGRTQDQVIALFDQTIERLETAGV